MNIITNSICQKNETMDMAMRHAFNPTGRIT